MKKINILAAFAAALSGIMFSAVSCQENYGEPDPFLDVPEADVKVDFSGKNYQGEIPYIEVGSNVSWKITATPEWVEPSILSAERGRRNVFLTCSENLSGSDREGLVTFSGAGIEKSVKVMQTLKTEILELSLSEIAVDGDGKLPSGQDPSFYIMNSNSNWSIETENWIKPDVTSGPAGQYITVTLSVEENNTTTDRQGKVTVKAGAKVEYVTVKQSVNGLEVSISDISVNKKGIRDNGSKIAFTVSAISAWTASAPEWVNLSSNCGAGGNVAVTVDVAVNENTTGALRTGKIELSLENGISTSIPVSQSSTLYEDDNLFFEDNFSWIDKYVEPYNKAYSEGEVKDGPIGDPVGTNDPNVFAAGVYYQPTYFGNFIPEANERGYFDLNPSKKSLYIQSAYLKFGKTNSHNGIKIAANGLDENPQDINLVFDWSAQTYQGKADEVSLTIEVENGGTVVTSMPIEHDQADGNLKWQTVSVRMNGMTSASSIIIRPTQMDITPGLAPTTQRWFLDNIKITRAK